MRWMQHGLWLMLIWMLVLPAAAQEDFSEDDVEPKKIISFDEDEGGLTPRLVNYAQSPEEAVEELIIQGIVPTSGRFAFEEERIVMTGEDEERQFVNLAQSARDLNVVMGATVFFDARSENPDILEFCGLAARAQPIELDEGVETTDYINVSVLDDGRVVAFDDLINGGEINTIEANLEIPIVVHLLFIAQGDTLALYIDGELRLFNLRITEEEGSYGVLLRNGDTRTTCEVLDAWAYTFQLSDDPATDGPIVIGSNTGLCFANGSVASKRAGPSVDSPVVDRFSGQDIEVVAETAGADGLTWYLLADDTYVREDVIFLIGDCTNLPLVGRP